MHSLILSIQLCLFNREFSGFADINDNEKTHVYMNPDTENSSLSPELMVAMVVTAPLIYIVYVAEINGSYSTGRILNLLKHRYFNSSLNFW